jgi:hypothetical protein
MRKGPISVLILFLALIVQGYAQNTERGQESQEISGNELIRMLRGSSFAYSRALDYIGKIYSKCFNNGILPDQPTLKALAEIVENYMFTPEKKWDVPAEELVIEAVKDSLLRIEAIEKIWPHAYRAAETYFKDPSPKNGEKFAMALPVKRNWPSNGERRLANLVFDFTSKGGRQNFSILEKDLERGEPRAIDVGFRLISISDGLAGEELIFVLGRIADRHPRLFLQKLRAYQGKTQPDVLELLSDMLYPVAWREQQQNEAGYSDLLEKSLNIRMEALKSVKDNELREFRDRCLKILEDPGYLKKSSSDKIDRTISREIDLTRDGKPEKVILHVTGKDFQSPFTWTMTIQSNDRRIFYKEHADTERFDSLFNEPEFWGDCHDYASCKSNWYFTDVMNLFFYPLKPIHLELMKNKENGPFTTFDEIRDLILKTGKATLVQASRIVEDLKRDIGNGMAICISPNVDPITMGPIFLWIPIIDDFVYIYDD